MGVGVVILLVAVPVRKVDANDCVTPPLSPEVELVIMAMVGVQAPPGGLLIIVSTYTWIVCMKCGRSG